MADKKPKTTRLKELFESPRLFVLPGGTSPVHALMAEKAGYEASELYGVSRVARAIQLRGFV